MDGHARPSNGAVKKANVLVSDIKSVTEVSTAVFGRDGVFKIAYVEPDQPERDLFIEVSDGTLPSLYARDIVYNFAHVSCAKYGTLGENNI